MTIATTDSQKKTEVSSSELLIFCCSRPDRVLWLSRGSG
jgi:hypothetical protein